MNSLVQISKKAKLGKDISIGPFTIIYDNVIIGNNTVIESHCILGCPHQSAEGKPLMIRTGSYIRSHSIFYEGSTFGPGLTTGHSVLVRENCVAGKKLQIGSYTDIEGSCQMGDYVKIHSDVHISTHSNIASFVWLYPRVQFTNDPFPPSDIREGITVKDMAVVATGTILLPGVTIGLGSFVGAGSVVRSDVPDGHCVSGNPATFFTTVDRFFDFKHRLSYPWPKHHKERYPEESYAQMDAIVEKINVLIERNKRSQRKAKTNGR